MKRAVQELSILNEIATAISSMHSLDKIVALIVDKCVKHLRVEQASVMLISKEKEGDPFQTMIRQADSTSEIIPYRLNTQLTGWMLKYQKPLVFDDFDSDDRLTTVDNEVFPIRSLLSVPMTLKGRMIGLITVFMISRHMQFARYWPSRGQIFRANRYALWQQMGTLSFLSSSII
ncbi:MAG: GAF domain-containing protein [candidate division KSB1 bacterium]|nr:GAF domain-containing protein [candidate division KSB1 bacterium]